MQLKKNKLVADMLKASLYFSYIHSIMFCGIIPRSLYIYKLSPKEYLNQKIKEILTVIRDGIYNIKNMVNIKNILIILSNYLMYTILLLETCCNN